MIGPVQFCYIPFSLKSFAPEDISLLTTQVWVSPCQAVTFCLKHGLVKDTNEAGEEKCEKNTADIKCNEGFDSQLLLINLLKQFSKTE